MLKPRYGISYKNNMWKVTFVILNIGHLGVGKYWHTWQIHPCPHGIITNGSLFRAVLLSSMPYCANWLFRRCFVVVDAPLNCHLYIEFKLCTLVGKTIEHRLALSTYFVPNLTVRIKKYEIPYFRGCFLCVNLTFFTVVDCPNY
jgi:hypothetical protein